MLLATARRRPTRSIRLATNRPTRVWTDLPLEQQQHLGHLVAVLVRRIRQQPQPDSRSEPLEIPYIRKEQVKARDEHA
jgi:hypothetical protein